MMQVQTAILTVITAFGVASAVAEPSLADPVKSEEAPAPRETALDHLLAERESPKAFESAIADARKNGVCEQAILEARFLYHVDRREDDRIAALLPEFLKQRDGFRIEDSAVFGVKEDWLAVIEYVQALDALGKGDKPAFKQHITEAFWLSPRQAAAFAPHIERLRLEECMRAVKIDFTTELPPLGSGESVALAKIIAGKKAMLFHFWSPSSEECAATMTDFATTAATLTASDIAVVSLLSNASPKLLAAARAMIRPFAEKPCGVWSIDSKDKSLARELRIQTLPAMVLVDNNGKVLFNGDPTDSAFWDALKKIDARINRPDTAMEKSE